MENVDKIKRGEPVRDPDKIVKATMAADAKYRSCGAAFRPSCPGLPGIHVSNASAGTA